MTGAERDVARLLAACRFTPGSFDKRFARDMGARALDPSAPPLTERQRESLWRTAHRYRRQLFQGGEGLSAERVREHFERRHRAMTEAEWLASDDPAAMLHALQSVNGVPFGTKVSDRKRRLFACACCRAMLPKINGHSAEIQMTQEIVDGAVNALDVSEAFADGLAAGKSLAAVREHTAGFAAIPWLAAINRACWLDDVPGSSQPLVSATAAACRRFDPRCGPAQAALLRDIFGNPFRPVKLPPGPEPPEARCRRCGCTRCTHESGDCLCDDCGSDDWVTPVVATPWHRHPAVLSLAHAAYDERGRWVPCRSCSGEGCSGNSGYLEPPGSRCDGSGRKWLDDGTLDPARLAVLADALEEAGCAEEELLRHLRGQEACFRCEVQAGTATRKVRLAIAGMAAQAGKGPVRDVYIPGCVHCNGTGWRPLRGPHVRGCHALDLLLGRD